jgi:Holliday junction resolvase RusA-like endonuclease
MIKLHIKPLTVNQAWQGKRFKTPKYTQYERDLLLLLPKISVPNAPFSIEITFGFSNKLSDVDNPLKPLLDVLQKKYGINDRDVYKLTVEKTIVPKGKEFIQFQIKSLDIE